MLQEVSTHAGNQLNVSGPCKWHFQKLNSQQGHYRQTSRERAVPLAGPRQDTAASNLPESSRIEDKRQAFTCVDVSSRAQK